MTNITAWYFASLDYREDSTIKTVDDVLARLKAKWCPPNMLQQYAKDYKVSLEYAATRFDWSVREKGFGCFNGWDKEIFEYRKTHINGQLPEDEVKASWKVWVRAVFADYQNESFTTKLANDRTLLDNYHLFITTREQAERYRTFKQNNYITDRNVFSKSDGYSVNRNMSLTDARLQWEILKFDQKHLDSIPADALSNALTKSINAHLVKIGVNDE